VKFDRRSVLALTASALATPVIISRAAAADGGAKVQSAVDRFAKLPATASCLVVAGHPGPADGVPEMGRTFYAGVTEILREAAQAVG